MAVLAFSFFTLQAQEDKSKRPSPFMHTEETLTDGVKVTMEYSSPQVKGREIWGKLVPFDQVWRTGANEATTIEFSTNVTINGKELPKGKYALFTIIKKGASDVTVIFSKQTTLWGSSGYKESEDALRVEVKTKKIEKIQEGLKFEITKSGEVKFVWEKLEFAFTVKGK